MRNKMACLRTDATRRLVGVNDDWNLIKSKNPLEKAHEGGLQANNADTTI